MASRFTLPHIEITRFISTNVYQGTGFGSSGSPRARAEHGRRLQGELAAAFRLADERRPQDERIEGVEGSYFEIELRGGTKAEILDRKRDGVRAGATNVADDNKRTIALLVPDAARPVLEKILEDYVSGPLSDAGTAPRQGIVEAIEAVRAARLETVWTDDPAALPSDAQYEMWWGLWCWKGSEERVEALCQRLEARVGAKDRWQHFPELTVIPVLARRATIELLLFSAVGIAELRRGSENPVFFTDEVATEQADWVTDLAERTEWPGSDAPAVCVLDTGVNRGHALLEPALSATDLHAVDSEWGVDDHHPTGHGTAMAGLALHGDLTAALADRSERPLKHRLESVKVLPPKKPDHAEPNTYGPITQAAVARAEIEQPERQRVFCMAVTNENVSGARPSAWSASIDQAAAGTMPGDDADAPKRLIVLAAGNTEPHIEMARIRPQAEYPAEDPAQAWNALTVGGYTDLIDVRGDGLEGYRPMAPAGDLSPHSRTSELWPQNAPFKPEIVMEAGNRAVNPGGTEAYTVGSLSLLSTGRDAATPLVAFQATSAATAQAARLAARVAADHPEFWPETIRGLLVHSAEWTGAMVSALEATTGKRDRYAVIRRFGYGVPDYERATASAESHLALFAQTDIQPFRAAGGRRFGDCHYYDLPIPRRLLEELENEVVELKVTLSYFVDPNPGLSSNVDPQRYQSHGLRFDLRRRTETLQAFKQRVNASERDDPKVAPRAEADDGRWLLGPQSVSAGSLHCDVWVGPAIELAGRDTLCVKPVVGWCRERASREICDTMRRYSLIVTLKARNPDIRLHTPISAEVELRTKVPIDVESLL